MKKILPIGIKLILITVCFATYVSTEKPLDYDVWMVVTLSKGQILSKKGYPPIPCSGVHLRDSKQIGKLSFSEKTVEARRQKFTMEVR